MLKPNSKGKSKSHLESAVSELTNPEQDFNAGNGSLGEGPYLENNNGNQVDKVDNEDEASSQVVPKRQHTQKLRHAMLFKQHEVKAKLCQVTAKDEFAGAGDIKDWADKLTSSKSLHTLLSQQSLSTNSCPPRSTSGTSTGSALKVSCSTPISSGASHASHASCASHASLMTCPASPDDLPAWSQPRDFYFDGPYIDGSDEAEHDADVTKVVSGSEVDEWVLPPPPIITKPSVKKGGASGKTAWAILDGKKWAQQNEVGPVPHCTFALSNIHYRQTPGSQGWHSGSGVNNKYIKGDLPPGSTVNNIWRWVFISALAHFAVTYNNPWTIPSKRFTSVLQMIWDTVYNASMAVIMTFFANDINFKDSKQCVDFTKVMLKRNHFLFSQNRGTDNKTWSGLWRAPFILQTFVHHFNFVQGQMEVPGLSGKLTGPCMWTAIIPKGNQYEFNDTIWGVAMRCYLEPIKGLSDENFTLVVDDTQNTILAILLNFPLPHKFYEFWCAVKHAYQTWLKI
ncbi:hypothetical protein BKA83DRAFT_4132748 [Pisolithus microcarpus]|nr:hypothetical protein BKA83DRAFT_4132748 [Pisolithus microcarpus]